LKTKRSAIESSHNLVYRGDLIHPVNSIQFASQSPQKLLCVLSEEIPIAMQWGMKSIGGTRVVDVVISGAGIARIAPAKGFATIGPTFEPMAIY
jgi:hypothetical protein